MTTTPFRTIQLGVLAQPLGLLSPKPVSIFSPEAIDRAIARAGMEVGDGHGAFVAHYDTDGSVTASAVQRVGNHLEVRAAVLWDGVAVSKEHLAFSGQIVGRW